MWLARLVVCSALGLCLDQAGLHIGDTLWYCILGLFLAYGWIHDIERGEMFQEVIDEVRRKMRERHGTDK